MKSFITSQFGYCPLIWMFHSRTLNKRINSIHERSLRITYSDKVSTFQELLEKDNSVSMHQRNLWPLKCSKFIKICHLNFLTTFSNFLSISSQLASTFVSISQEMFVRNVEENFEKTLITMVIQHLCHDLLVIRRLPEMVNNCGNSCSCHSCKEYQGSCGRRHGSPCFVKSVCEELA